MFHKLKNVILKALIERARELAGPDTLDWKSVDLRVPEPRWGDLSTNLALMLSGKIGRPGREIASFLRERLMGLPEVRDVELAGPGFLNLRLNRMTWIERWFNRRGGMDVPSFPFRHIVVEHTSINPNKAAHVGHLRNAVLGDTLARAWKFLGVPVTVQNYIDDTGIQLADVVTAFLHMEKIQDSSALDALPEPFDFYCWDLYARVQEWLEENPEHTRLRNQVLHDLEAQRGLTAELGKRISHRITLAHLRTMERLDIRYDLLPRESSILALKFWEHAFTQLKESGAIQYASEGKQAGCWVLPLRGRPEWDAMEEPDKILVRSDGTVTYVAKDIAYQLWKLGLLGRDFYYEPFYRYFDGHEVWTATASGARPESLPKHIKGQGDRVYNVIDVRQSYLQDIVVEAVCRMGYPDARERSIHFSYEMVALSPKTASRLGVGEDSGKPMAISGRKGIGVKADDLLDAMENAAAKELERRSPDLDAKERQRRASDIMRGAIRYYLLKYSRNTILSLDIDEALDLEGETGVYIQYAWVRARNILDKAGLLNDPFQGLGKIGFIPPTEAYWNSDEGQDTWWLVYRATMLDDVVFKAVESLELNTMTTFLYQYCQAFHRYYLKYRVLQEPDPALRSARLLAIVAAYTTFSALMGILGIPRIEKM